MAVVFEEDFSNGTLGDPVLTANTSYSAQSGTSPVFATSPVDNDLAAEFDGALGFGTLTNSFPVTTVRTISRYVVFNDGAITPGNVILFAAYSEAATTHRAQVTIRSNRRFGIRNSQTLVASTDHVMIPGMLYRLLWKIDGSSQTLEVRDGVSDSLIETLVGACDASGFDSLRDGFGNDPGSSLTMLLDRCVDEDIITDIPPYIPEDPGGGSPAEIALIGEASAVAYSSSLTINYSSTAGSTLILYTGFSDAGDTIVDTAGNTWTLAADTVPYGANAQRQGQLYYCINAEAITSVTISRSFSSHYLAGLSEWSGIDGLREARAGLKSGGEIPIAAEAGDLVFGIYFRYESNYLPNPIPDGYTGLTPVIRDGSVSGSAYAVAAESGSQGPVWDSVPNTGIINAVFIPAVSDSDPNPDPDPEALFSWNGDNGQPLPEINTGGVSIVPEGLRPPAIRMDATDQTRSIAYWDVGSHTQGTVRAYFRTPSAWTGNSASLVQFTTGWSANRARFAVGGSGQPGQVRITSDAGNIKYSVNGVVQVDTWYRLEFMADLPSGLARFYLYLGDSLTPYHDSGWVSIDSADSYDRVRVGIDHNTGSEPYLFDDIVGTDRLELIGPAGVSSGSGPSVTVWDGTQRLPAIMRGVWDGNQILPAKIKF